MLVDGAVVANDWADLTDGYLANGITLNELGGPAPTKATACNKTAALDCFEQ